MARSKKKWDESSVTRDENGRFVAWSMDIQVGGQRIQRSGPNVQQPPRPASSRPPAPIGISPSHQKMIDMKQRWNQQMLENLRNNRVSPTTHSSRRSSKKPKIA